MNQPIVAITMGDIAGIGPEVVWLALQDPRVRACCRPLVIGHPLLLERAARLRPTVGELDCEVLAKLPASRQELESRLPADGNARPAVCNPAGDAVLEAPAATVSAAAGEAAYRGLIAAIRMAQLGVVDAIATAPLNKESLRAAGHLFPGHTEILAHECGVEDFAMMLFLPESRLAPLRAIVGDESLPTSSVRQDANSDAPTSHGLSIAHVTLHTSIASVPGLLSQESIVATTQLMQNHLARLGCARQAIAVAALNPHAGEHGLFGDEETRIIGPAVQQAADAGCNVSGPLPADALIRRAVAGQFDGVIAMYHDQGHIPIKLLGFDSAVNMTLGLPIVRTSPTHGTAFDRAWNPATPADPAGMVEAIVAAARLVEAA